MKIEGMVGINGQTVAQVFNVCSSGFIPLYHGLTVRGLNIDSIVALSVCLKLIQYSYIANKRHFRCCNSLITSLRASFTLWNCSFFFCIDSVQPRAILEVTWENVIRSDPDWHHVFEGNVSFSLVLFTPTRTYRLVCLSVRSFTQNIWMDLDLDLDGIVRRDLNRLHIGDDQGHCVCPGLPLSKYDFCSCSWSVILTPDRLIHSSEMCIFLWKFRLVHMALAPESSCTWFMFSSLSVLTVSFLSRSLFAFLCVVVNVTEGLLSIFGWKPRCC